MVNVIRSDAKQHILKILRATKTPMTGEKIGQRVGMSRVGIHKHVLALRKSGYCIDSSTAGYKLLENTDFPFTSWEFDASEKVVVLKKTGSTMDDAHKWAQRNPGRDYVVAALRQEYGRDQQAERWDSPEGGLWATWLMHPSGSSLHLPLYIIAGAVGLKQTLLETLGVHTQVRWPNDVMAGSKKIAGILGEAHTYGDRISYLALGLGLHVNNTVNSSTATNLYQITGQIEDRRVLLRSWLQATKRIISLPQFGQTVNGWNPSILYHHQTAKFQLATSTITGKIQGIDSLGRLKMQSPTGKRIRLASGDVKKAFWPE